MLDLKTALTNIADALDVWYSGDYWPTPLDEEKARESFERIKHYLHEEFGWEDGN